MNFDNLLYDEFFVMVDNLLISRNHPQGILDDTAWKLYVYSQLYANYDFGTHIHGKKSFSKIMHCSDEAYKKYVSTLVTNHLIKSEKYPDPCNFTKTTVLMAPLYDNETQTFIPYLNCAKTGFAFEVYKVHFTMAPKTALFNALKTLSVGEIRLLLKLYRFNNLRLFYGVDCNAVRCVNGEWYIHPRILFDMYIDEEEAIEIVNELINKGFLQLNEVGLHNENFGHESRLRISACREASQSITIITPAYQYRERSIERVGVQDAIERVFEAQIEADIPRN